MPQITSRRASKPASAGIANPAHVTIKLFVNDEVVDMVETEQPSESDARELCQSLREAVEEMIAEYEMPGSDFSLLEWARRKRS